jgi:hypothetical protein
VLIYGRLSPRQVAFHNIEMTNAEAGPPQRLIWR